MVGIQVLPPPLLSSLSSASRPPAPPPVCQALLPKKRDLGARPVLPPQKTQSPYEEALLQKTRDSRDILKCTGRFREVSGQGRQWSLCKGAEGEWSPGPVGVRLILIWCSGGL